MIAVAADMPVPDSNRPILSVRNLQAHFRTSHFGVNRYVRAVDGISFEVRRGEIYGLAGESSSGKTTLVKTIAGTAYGALVAWIAFLIIVNVSVPGLGVVWPALVVGVTVFCLVIVASVDALSAVPANVYGYAALVAYSLHQPSAPGAGGQMGTGPLQNLTSANFANPLVLLIVSLVFGALLGYASAQLAKALTRPSPSVAA